MVVRGAVVVAILNNRLDFDLARRDHWYRIPVDNVRKWLRNWWIPEWLAFYQTKVFGPEAYTVQWYARVRRVERVQRKDLFPDERSDPKADRWYYKLVLSDLKRLPRPIVSRRRRRIVFIRTVWEKFITAYEINDLYTDSPLEDRLWAEFKRLRIVAERQEWVKVKGRQYALDFAVYCASGKLAVETDGDTWHSDPARIPLDNRRDNDPETDGWSLLRFNTKQIQEEMTQNVMPTVVEIINNLGGVDEGKDVPRYISPDNTAGLHQMNLFYAPPDSTEEVGTADKASAATEVSTVQPPSPPRQEPLLDIPPAQLRKPRKRKN